MGLNGYHSGFPEKIEELRSSLAAEGETTMALAKGYGAPLHDAIAQTAEHLIAYVGSLDVPSWQFNATLAHVEVAVERLTWKYYAKRVDVNIEEEVEPMESTSDQRVKNNVMRHEYRALDETEKIQMQHIKDMGLQFVESCDAIGHSRELSLAKTKMEEAVMWAVKHVTK